jgi:5-formyltetrahydrofolate cyclo-ligase
MKEKIRKEFLAKRDRLTQKEIEKKSALIKERILLLPEFIQAKRILTYFEKGSEVRTSTLITHMLKESKEVILPITVPKEKRLLLSRIMSLEELQKGPFGIFEPTIMRMVPLDSIELAILPGIVFDLQGNRIGYGGGYFDRLLRELSATFIGLAYEIQIAHSLPHSEEDVRMDKIVTERRVIEINSPPPITKELK